MPDIVVALPLPQVSDGGLPVVYVVDAIAMRGTSTGEADETGLQVCNGLGKILAQTVAVTLVCVLGEERYEVQMQLSLLLWFYHQLGRLGIELRLTRRDGLLLSSLEGGGSQYLTLLTQRNLDSAATLQEQ